MLLVYVEPVLASLFAPGALRWAGAVCWTSMDLAFQPTLLALPAFSGLGIAAPGDWVFYLMAPIILEVMTI
jgi:hypothetical protein